MTNRGEQSTRSSASTEAIQAFASDTTRYRKPPETYRKSRLRVLATAAAGLVLAAATIYPHLKGGDAVDAASPTGKSAQPTATASANANTAPESGISFDCDLTGLNLDMSNATSESTKISLQVKATGRDHVTFRAPAFIEGALDDTQEAPLLGDGGAGEGSLTANVPKALDGKILALYAISENDSTLCGTFSYDGEGDGQPHFESGADVPTSLPS